VQGTTQHVMSLRGCAHDHNQGKSCKTACMEQGAHCEAREAAGQKPINDKVGRAYSTVVGDFFECCKVVVRGI